MSQLDYTFFPLSGFDLTPPTPQSKDTPEWQLTLSKILHEYWALPHIASATVDYSNLAITLSNMGYGSQQKASQHTLLNAKRLYRDMVGFFGEPLMVKIFAGEKGLCIINRACKWAVATPERYAVLQCFAGLDSTTMFSKVRIEDRLESKLRDLQQSKTVYTKKQIMEQLGVTASQLDILARKYNIAPFWRQIGGESKQGLHKFSLVLDDEENQLFKAALKKSGYRYDRHFIRHCVLTFICEYSKDHPT